MSPLPKREPILIPCEGGGNGNRGHDDASGRTMCRMCGHWFTPMADRTVPSHHRDDIIARITRGDFDA